MHLKICCAIIKRNLYNYFYKIDLDKIFFFLMFFSLKLFINKTHIKHNIHKNQKYDYQILKKF